MPSKKSQVVNGKAFEYSIANQYYKYISSLGLNVELVGSKALTTAKECYDSLSQLKKDAYNNAAFNTIYTMVLIEPGLITQGDSSDVLKISLNGDFAGEDGDVRDVIFTHTSPKWEIGISAKNNNDAVKHSRLGHKLDFAQSWLGVNCSDSYWDAVRPIFDYIEEKIQSGCKWSDLGDEKLQLVYVPLLKAFLEEIVRINENHDNIPEKLIEYLIGSQPFYKVIKDDAHNLVVVKSFNMRGKLNQSYMGVKSRYSTPKITFPTRIVELDFKKDSDTTLHMILNGGWEISFRIHSASTKVERSLKFDIQLLGNPPILFSQHIFQ